MLVKAIKVHVRKNKAAGRLAHTMKSVLALLSTRQQDQQLKIPAALSAALGVLRGKTKPFSSLIISMLMRQRCNFWPYDVTLQDCGRVASVHCFEVRQKCG